MMNKTILISISAAILALTASCAKEAKVDSKEAALRYIESWLSVHHPDAVETDGVYILSETAGTGDTWDIDEAGIAYVQSTIRNLDGSVSSTNFEETARQIGTWKRTGYYGPSIWLVSYGGVPDGYKTALEGMRIGGERTVLIPSWLNSGSSHTIMEMRFEYQSDNFFDYQVDRLKEFSAAYMSNVDSTWYNGTDGDRFGFYFKRLREGETEDAMPSDTTVYINYTGRRLDGVVFDTTIADTAKFYGIFDASKTYEPIPIYWSSTVKDIKMTTSKTTPITGFQYMLWQMRPGEKAIAAFYSQLGYGANTSGSSIPAYSPLSFTIDLVEKP